MHIALQILCYYIVYRMVHIIMQGKIIFYVNCVGYYNLLANQRQFASLPSFYFSKHLKSKLFSISIKVHFSRKLLDLTLHTIFRHRL